MTRRLLAFAVLCVFGLSTFAAAPAAETPFALNGTQIISFTAKDKTRAYQLYVSLPRHYAQRTAERFPVIYLLDADYSFAMTHNLLRHFTDRHLAREAIVVGIAYPGAEGDMDLYHRMRTRDYTPSFTLENGYGPEVQKLSGGGPAFLPMLADELLPMIDRKFRTDPADRMIVGNSFGGAFATYALLARPGLFRNYLIVSPSLWYDHKMIFAMADRYIAGHRALPVRVFFSVGGEENQPPPSGSMMVDDLKTFFGKLSAANLSGYEASLVVFSGESHESVLPAALSRGIRVLYGYAGEAKTEGVETP
jgi:uncharacterized protein